MTSQYRLLRHFGWLIAALIVLPGCTPERQVQEIVRKALLDPDSGRFEGSTNVLGTGMERVACGLVNGKNRLGGYAGTSPYMLYGNKLYMSSNDTASNQISDCCSAVFSATLRSEKLAAMPADKCTGLVEPMTVIDGVPY